MAQSHLVPSHTPHVSAQSLTSLPLVSGLKDSLKDKAKLKKGIVIQDELDIMGRLSDDHASSVHPQFEKRKAGTVNVVSLLISYTDSWLKM
jgi:hypothetical protein